MLGILSRFIDPNAKEVKRLGELVGQINSLEEGVKKLKDKDFGAKTLEFKKRIDK